MKSTKKKLYLNLSWKEASTSYGKGNVLPSIFYGLLFLYHHISSYFTDFQFLCWTVDDIWVISKDLTFDPRSTFLAKSVYHGPSSNNDVEIEPLACYSTSNWPSPCKYCFQLVCDTLRELSALVPITGCIGEATAVFSFRGGCKTCMGETPSIGSWLESIHKVVNGMTLNRVIFDPWWPMTQTLTRTQTYRVGFGAQTQWLYWLSWWLFSGTVHAILACNASSELVCLSNLKEHVNSTSVPILQSLINR